MSDEQIVSALWNQGTLVDLHIGRSTFQKKLRDKDLRLEGINKGAVHLGHKKLLPEKSLDTIKKIENEARSFLDIHSLAFPISGARFVYYKTLKEVIDYFIKKRNQWDDAVDDLIMNFEGLKTQQIAVLDTESKKLMERSLDGLSGQLLIEKTAEVKEWFDEQQAYHRSLYPQIADLHKSFSLEWRLFKISAVDGMSVMGEFEKDELIEAQQKIKKEMQQWVKEASAALHKKLGEAAINAAAMLDKQGKLNPKNLKPLFDAFEEFKAVDFTGSSDFHTKIDDMRKKFLVTNKDGNIDFSLTADSLNNAASTMASFKGVLTTIGELAVDSVAEQAGLSALTKVGEFKRLIEI